MERSILWRAAQAVGENTSRSKRDAALKRVERLDCKKTGDSLASCDPEAKERLPEVEEWRRTLEGGRGPDESANRRALAQLFSDLLCSGDADAIHVLRGLTKKDPLKDTRLEAAGGEAVTLIDKILDDKYHCPVSAALAAGGRAKLLEIKKSAQESRQSGSHARAAAGAKQVTG